MNSILRPLISIVSSSNNFLSNTNNGKKSLNSNFDQRGEKSHATYIKTYRKMKTKTQKILQKMEKKDEKKKERGREKTWIIFAKEFIQFTNSWLFLWRLFNSALEFCYCCYLSLTFRFECVCMCVCLWCMPCPTMCSMCIFNHLAVWDCFSFSSFMFLSIFHIINNTWIQRQSTHYEYTHYLLNRHVQCPEHLNTENLNIEHWKLIAEHWKFHW